MISQILFWQPNNFHFQPLVFFFSHWFLWLLIFALSFSWLLRRKIEKLSWFWVLLVLSEILEMLIKHFSPWDRPFYQTGTQPPDWISGYSRGSFPSGHAMRSAIVLIFLWREDKRLFWLFLPGIILVNLGRVLFGLHYPIDIFGGLTLGFILVKSEKLACQKLMRLGRQVIKS